MGEPTPWAASTDMVPPVGVVRMTQTCRKTFGPGSRIAIFSRRRWAFARCSLLTGSVRANDAWVFA